MKTICHNLKKEYQKFLIIKTSLKLNDKTLCYHLESVELDIKENKTEQIIFSDDGFYDFVSGLIYNN